MLVKPENDFERERKIMFEHQDGSGYGSASRELSFPSGSKDAWTRFSLTVKGCIDDLGGSIR